MCLHLMSSEQAVGKDGGKDGTGEKERDMHAERGKEGIWQSGTEGNNKDDRIDEREEYWFREREAHGIGVKKESTLNPWRQTETAQEKRRRDGGRDWERGGPCAADCEDTQTKCFSEDNFRVQAPEDAQHAPPYRT